MACAQGGALATFPPAASALAQPSSKRGGSQPAAGSSSHLATTSLSHPSSPTVEVVAYGEHELVASASALRA